MDKAVLRPDQELREIVYHLKNLIAIDREMGLEAPKLSASTIAYMDRGPSEGQSLEGLKKFIGECTRCKLSDKRTHLVFGEGSESARLVFVGEGPGREEDLAGRPFVGEAGKLLTKIIENGMNLKREDVYICNIIKCHTPGNRDPESDEIDACLPFLKKQLVLIQPEVICVLGRIAAQSLLGRDFKITRERGLWQSFEGISVMPTFHPAYILRNPGRERELKGLVWEDIKKIMKRMGLEGKRNA